MSENVRKFIAAAKDYGVKASFTADVLVQQKNLLDVYQCVSDLIKLVYEKLEINN